MPELGLSFPADIWTLAYSIWIILGQHPLFEDILATPDDITAEQVDTLGELPLRWQKKWETRHEYFDERGLPNQGQQVRSLDERFKKHIQLPRWKAMVPEFDAEEKAAVMNMLRPMLSFEPKERLTAHEILKCEWMEKWALPDDKEICLDERGGCGKSL
jgi:serine/threonine protein kinase